MLCQICKAENPEDATVCVACGSTPTLAPGATMSGGAIPMGPAKLAGQIVAGRYEVKSILGKGGMGVVYRAFDRMLNEDVAIKLLHGAAIDENKSDDQERLKREIQTARRITHPNVIRIHDMGVDGEDGFLAMEILVGGSLNRRLASGLPPTAEAVQIAIGICDGLAAAHAKGIIHRDLKPHNVLFDADGTPKLVDFGLARLAEATSHTMGFSGTPLYMSPEMTDGREITTRSDVYSLGVVLYELFCGRTPFRADTLLRLAMMHAKETPPSPRSVRADLPEPIERILLKCLEKEPEHRFANAKEVGDALRAWQAGSPLAFTVRIPGPTAEQPAAAVVSAPPKRRMTAARRFAALSGSALATCLAFAVVYPRMHVRFSSERTPSGAELGVSVDSLERADAPPPKIQAAASSRDAAADDDKVGDFSRKDEPVPKPTAMAGKLASARATPRHAANHDATPAPTKVTLAMSTPPPVPDAKVAGPPALLTLLTDGTWANVWIDDRPTVTTTQFKKREVASGRHRYRFHSPDGVEFETTVELPAGDVCLYVDYAAKRVSPCKR